MKRPLVILTIFTILYSAILFIYLDSKEKKVVYADTIKLFNEYKFKTDMEKASQGTLAKLKNDLDSVEMIFKLNPNNPEVRQLVFEKQQIWERGYNEINKEINAKVWERLNLSIREFGMKKDIQLLIGANGMGTVLYASDAKDVTGDLIKYANENYAKGN